MLWVMAAILVCGSTVFTSCVKEDNPVTTDTTKKEVLYQWIADYAEVVTDESEGTLYDRVVKVYEFFNDGDVITVEPWRSAAFPVIKDCMVDRGAFDKIIQAGGYTTIRTGQAQDANAILIPKEDADEAMDCASCIGCGACVAACKNGSAMLFVSSKVSQLALLPQGRVEAARRVKNMIAKMDELGFGNCTNTRACEAVCPKNETIANIARLNREMIKAKLAD